MSFADHHRLERHLANVTNDQIVWSLPGLLLDPIDSHSDRSLQLVSGLLSFECNLFINVCDLLRPNIASIVCLVPGIDFETKDEYEDEAGLTRDVDEACIALTLSWQNCSKLVPCFADNWGFSSVAEVIPNADGFKSLSILMAPFGSIPLCLLGSILQMLINIEAFLISIQIKRICDKRIVWEEKE